MKHIRIVSFFIGLTLILSCTEKKIEYSSKEKLEKFINNEKGIDIKEERNDFLVIILQNEDCICTLPDVKLTKKMFESEKYSKYKKILIVNSKKHKIFDMLSGEGIKSLSVIINENNNLLKAGYIAMTDRVILYKEGNCSYYADLHQKKPAEVQNELF